MPVDFGAFPVRDTSRPFFDPTGKIAAGAQVICEDTFEHDARGWVPLRLTGSMRSGTVIRNSRGGWHIQARTPNTSGIGAMAIKRMAQNLGGGRHLVEFLTHAEDTNLDRTRPRYREFGLDTARTSDGTRFFHCFRWLQYDETAVSAANYWQYQGAGGAWFTLPGGGTLPINGGFWPTNENKKLPFYLAIEVDTQTGAYLGFRFGDWIKVGSLADVPDDAAFGGAVPGGAPTDLDIFAGGLNPFFGIVNRTVTLTASAQGIEWHRLSKVG